MQRLMVHDLLERTFAAHCCAGIEMLRVLPVAGEPSGLLRKSRDAAADWQGCTVNQPQTPCYETSGKTRWQGRLTSDRRHQDSDVCCSASLWGC